MAITSPLPRSIMMVTLHYMKSHSSLRRNKT
nr:MAG TPA: hypothetical protein [Caudoviricetes sp.]